MSARVSDVLPAEGPHSGLPADPGVVPALYSCTDHNVIYRWDGTDWSSWAVLGGGGTSVVTAEGSITKIDGPMTQAAYDAIGSPAADTLYVIVG